MNLKRIISGGQTGADRGALDAALEIGFPCGGWCPEGRLANDGRIPDRYPVHELVGAGYRRRTIRNIEESDATAIFCVGVPVGGTALTLTQCVVMSKANCLIDAGEFDVAQVGRVLAEFVRSQSIGVLNVAGPSESRCPGIHAYVRTGIAEMFRELAIIAKRADQ